MKTFPRQILQSICSKAWILSLWIAPAMNLCQEKFITNTVWFSMQKCALWLLKKDHFESNRCYPLYNKIQRYVTLVTGSVIEILQTSLVRETLWVVLWKEEPIDYHCCLQFGHRYTMLYDWNRCKLNFAKYNKYHTFIHACLASSSFGWQWVEGWVRGGQ